MSEITCGLPGGLPRRDSGCCRNKKEGDQQTQHFQQLIG